MAEVIGGPPAEAHAAGSGRLALAGVLGALVSITLGIYGRVHNPASDLAITLGFQSTISMKVWLATAALAFAVVQALTALWMYGRLPLGDAPEAIGPIHRIAGRLAFLLTLPVAYHCLYQLGFQSTSTRVLVHSLAGCAVYGAFAAKVVIVRSPKLPGAALPIAGAVMFSTLVLVWLTSALWLIDKQGFPSP
jgi:hypothetical protein